jgi:hypothetical protein
MYIHASIIYSTAHIPFIVLMFTSFVGSSLYAKVLPTSLLSLACPRSAVPSLNSIRTRPFNLSPSVKLPEMLIKSDRCKKRHFLCLKPNLYLPCSPAVFEKDKMAEGASNRACLAFFFDDVYIFRTVK